MPYRRLNVNVNTFNSHCEYLTVTLCVLKQEKKRKIIAQKHNEQRKKEKRNSTQTLTGTKGRMQREAKKKTLHAIKLI